MNAWTFQDYRAKQKLGDKAPWSVGWFDPDGKKRSKTIGSHSAAEKFQRKIEGQLAAGTYQGFGHKSWDAFVEELQDKILSGMSPRSRKSTWEAIQHFARIVNPKRSMASRRKPSTSTKPSDGRSKGTRRAP